mgnify:CR=1 FL=1
MNNYTQLITAAKYAAGAGDSYWNERFLSALDVRGLTIVDHQQPDSRYPSNLPVQAPAAYLHGDVTWPTLSYIVWKSEFTANTCAGFCAQYQSLVGSQPSNQQIWDAAIASYKSRNTLTTV